MKAIRVQETGGPEKLMFGEVDIPNPGAGQVRVAVRAIGVNFIDIYHRSGLYKVPLPFTLGVEAAGVVDAVGDGVLELSPGERVAFAMNLGTYAEFAVAHARHVVKLPRTVDFPTAAALMLQGMTAHYLTTSTFDLQSGHTALVHAAAGGVGLLLVQICRMIGANVIGTVSTEEKAKLASEAGANHVVRYDQVDFEAEVKEITGGTGVDVVYDSVGRSTFEKSLNCLKRRGMLVLFGQSSGPVAPVDLTILNARGSLYVTRPSLAHYTASEEETRWRAGEILEWLAEGTLKLRIDKTFPLREAADAHRALESRQTIGKLLLLP